METRIASAWALITQKCRTVGGCQIINHGFRRLNAVGGLVALGGVGLRFRVLKFFSHLHSNFSFVYVDGENHGLVEGFLGVGFSLIACCDRFCLARLASRKKYRKWIA
jgi:hypothetical protein